MPNKNEINIIIKADGKAAEKGVSLVETSVKGLEKELVRAQKELIATLKNLNRASSQYQKTADKVAVLKSEVKRLRTDNAQLTRANISSQKSLENLTKSAEKTDTKLRSLRKGVASLKKEKAALSNIVKKLQSELAQTANKVSRLEAKLSKSGTTFNTVNQSLKKQAKSVKSAKESWMDYSMGLNQGLELLSKSKRYIETGWNFAKQGAVLQEAREGFKSYTASVGKSSQEILTKLKKVSSGTISEMSLIKSASAAMGLGVTKDADKLANLLEIARLKARRAGRTVTEAFDDIVTGIGRASPLILDNLHIRIPAGFEKMTQGMTDTEKIAKLLELTLESGNKELEAMGGLTDSDADKFRQLETAATDLGHELGILATQVLLPSIEYMRDLARETKDVVDYYKDWLGLIDISDRNKHQGLAYEFEQKYKSTDELNNQERKLSQQLETLKHEYSQMHVQASKPGMEGVRNPADTAKLANKLDEITELQKKLTNLRHNIHLQTIAINKEIDGLKAEHLASGLFEDDIDGFLGIMDEISAEADLLEKDLTKSSKGIETSTKRIGKSFQYVADNAPDFSDIYSDLKAFFDDAEDDLDDFSDGLEDDIEVLVNFEAAWKRINKAAGKGLLGEQAKNQVFTESERLELLQNLNPEQAINSVKNLAFGLSGIGVSMSDLLESNGQNPTKKLEKDLSQTISKAIVTGFANIDLSDFGASFANVLSGVLTNSVASANPVLNTAGTINWGNFGLNLAANYGGRLLTGLFTTKEKDKEVIGQYSSLKDNITDSVLQTYKTELLPYLSHSQALNGLGESRNLGGASIGYKWKKGWSWSDLTNVKDYDLIDNGGSGALNNINEAIETAEDFNRKRERELEILEAKGYSTLSIQLDAVDSTLSRVTKYMDNDPSHHWSDGSSKSIDLSDDIHDLQITQIKLAQQINQDKAALAGVAAQSFMSYAPWLSQMPTANGEQRWSEGGKLYDSAGISLSDQYDLFGSLQGGVKNRYLDPYLLDMVKDAGQNKFDLSSLQLTDPEAYSEEYNKYLDKQINVYQEIMKRQEEIYKDETKSYEEQLAALELYEQTMDAVHKTKLEKIAKEQQQDEEVARKKAEASQAKMESALSLMGELSQRGDKIVILKEGDASLAIEELMEQFADNPEVTTVLQPWLDKANKKAKFGRA